MTMDIYRVLTLVYSKYVFRMLLLLMFLATPPPDIQHLRALAMFLCNDCTRPPPDPILDIGHRLICDRENMLIGRNMLPCCPPSCVFPDNFTNKGFFYGNVRALFRFMQDHLSTKDEFATPIYFFSVGLFSLAKFSPQHSRLTYHMLPCCQYLDKVYP